MTLIPPVVWSKGGLLKERPGLGPWRPPVGIAPRLGDAELVTLAMMQAVLG